MDTQAFWNVIGEYNERTIIIQIALLLFIIASLVLSYLGKVKWMAKFALGITNLFIGFVFFGYYGTETIQKLFAFPLYILIGILFLYESYKNKEDELSKPNWLQGIFLLLYLFYPFVSLMLGNSFPQMVTYIMPCPIVSLSIAVYADYRKKNRLLLILLTIWGLTGIKSIFFNAYEDIILLMSGMYGIKLIASKRSK